MRFSWPRTAMALLAMVMSAVFVSAFGSPASAGTLYYKVGKHVTKAHVFSGSTSNNTTCFSAAGHAATLCIRFDRRTLYVRSDKKDGYFKLGQIASAGKTFRCKNNYKKSSGQGTWVACHWNWPKKGCYTLRTGHGQADWYKLSFAGPLKCY